MESKAVENWSLCLHGQCIHKFMYEVKRINDKCKTEAIINLKKTKLRSRTVLKYKIHVEVRNSRNLSLLREITENLCNTF